MLLPVFEEIKTKNFEIDEIRFLFHQHKVGKRPCFLKMPNETADKLRSFLINILLVLKEMKIDPRFPYPLYLISKVKLNSKIIPQLKTEQEIPRYFFCKNLKITSRESSLINKLSIIRERMHNFNYDNLLEDIEQYSRNHKEIFNLVIEGEFYNSILKSWKKSNYGTKKENT